MMRLITPKRLKENEEFMWTLADRQIDEFLGRGRCEFVGEFAAPYTLLVIADLLGVPDADRQTFRSKLASPADLTKGGELEHRPLEFLYEQFTAYIEDAAPRPTRRGHDRAGHRDVPRRFDPGRPRRGAHRREPLRRRPGDDGPPALGGAPGAR